MFAKLGCLRLVKIPDGRKISTIGVKLDQAVIAAIKDVERVQKPGSEDAVSRCWVLELAKRNGPFPAETVRPHPAPCSQVFADGGRHILGEFGR